ncbi:unnamed protein product, partial [Staurois parvus]
GAYGHPPVPSGDRGVLPAGAWCPLSRLLGAPDMAPVGLHVGDRAGTSGGGQRGGSAGAAGGGGAGGGAGRGGGEDGAGEQQAERELQGEDREGVEDKMTRGDLLSNLRMASLIKNSFPGVQVNTEEHLEEADKESIWDRKMPDDIKDKIQTAKLVPTESITVWIDPLDATHEYTENLVNYVTTMVCVAVDGKPVIGVIHKPFTHYTAWAMVEGGSNVKRRASYDEKSPTIIVSRSHSGKVKEVTLQTFGNHTKIISAGGSGYKVLSLLDVTGNEKQETADVYIHVTYIKKWDICAGNAILSALGGQMTNLKGEDVIYTGLDGNEGGLLASIGMDHNALVEKLASKISD